jgi:metallo-beta-lactamase family protein
MEDRDAGRDLRLVFSGDIGRIGLPLVRDPETIDFTDLLILESTYGARLHEPMPDTANRLKQIVNEIYERKGVLVIPAFAVGRTQQLVYELQKLHTAGEIPTLPIFVDSPLAIDATSVFRQHPECFDAETHRYMTEYHDEDVFGFSQLQYTRPVEESIKLNTMDPPFIVISASGMAEAGRILHHLRNRIEDPANQVLIVGWQAPHTLGRRLVEGVSPVSIFGQKHRVRAKVSKLNGLSGHADSQELVDWVAAMEKRPRKTFLVHGEPESAEALATRLHEQLELDDVVIPDRHQQFEWPEA